MFLAYAVVETPRPDRRQNVSRSRPCLRSTARGRVREALRAFADSGDGADRRAADGPGWEGLGDLVAKAAALASTAVSGLDDDGQRSVERIAAGPGRSPQPGQRPVRGRTRRQGVLARLRPVLPVRHPDHPGHRPRSALHPRRAPDERNWAARRGVTGRLCSGPPVAAHRSHGARSRSGGSMNRAGCFVGARPVRLDPVLRARVVAPFGGRLRTRRCPQGGVRAP